MRYFGNNGLAVRPRIINFKASFTLGVYGRAKGTVRSKAEPWNERRLKNVTPEARVRPDDQLRSLPKRSSGEINEKLTSYHRKLRVRPVGWR